MTESFISLCCANSYWTNAGCYVSNTAITLSQAQTDKASTRHDGPLCWLVLGKQPQWGYSGYAVNFPISFDIVYNVLSIPQNTASTSNSYWGRFYITNLTKNGFTVSDTGAGSNRWLAIGKAQPQWGFTGRNIKTWVYPIQFNNVFGVVGTWNRSSGAIYESITIDKITNISCGIDGAWSGGSSVKYECLTIAIGLQQQWGYYVESQSETDYRYWPISFIFHYVTMATKTYYEPKEEAVPWLVGIDMQKFICGYGANFIGSNYVSCVAIGCQLQWGFTNNTGRPYITFPLKFSNVFTAISCICHNGSPSEANTVYNVSISGMNIGASGGGSGKYWCAFGISQPQWGFCGAGTINLPISFVEQIFICIVTDMTSSVNNSDGYFSWNPDKSAISSILITSSSGAGGGNYIVIGF